MLHGSSILTLCTFTETLLHSYEETVETVLIPFQEYESDEETRSEFHWEWVAFEVVSVRVGQENGVSMGYGDASIMHHRGSA